VRIIQVIPSLAAGGLERVATTLTLELHRAGDRVVVCTRGATHHRRFLEELEAAAVPIVRIHRPRPRPDLLLRAAVDLARVVRRERPDLLHAHNPAAAAAAATARVLAGRRDLPVVATFHGLVTGSAASAVRLLRRAADVVVAVSPAAADELVEAGLGRGRVATVLNAVAVPELRPREEVRRELGLEDAELVVTVGRYRAEKNQRLLIEAARLLAPERPRLRALIVGIGDLEEELRAQAREAGLGDVVTVTGLRPDPVDLAGAADVVTLTSTREALGLTLLEAMAAGTPVIGTAVGGIPDAVDDGRTGLLVPSGDARALADALRRLLDDRELARRLAAAGREEVERRFSVAAMTAGYRAVYDSALRARPARRRTGASPSK
jgi:glycosyltransferase involved in cell wall biosynthesis